MAILVFSDEEKHHIYPYLVTFLRYNSLFCLTYEAFKGMIQNTLKSSSGKFLKNTGLMSASGDSDLLQCTNHSRTKSAI